MSTPPKLIGHYHPPRVRKGDRVDCLYRDKLCVVTSWSDSPISWPRVRGLETRGGTGLWVNDELARAIRTESALALRHWFGVSDHVTWRWRKSLGVGGHATTPGSRKAIRAAALKGGVAIKVKEWTDEECDARAEAMRQRNQIQYCGPRWTPANGGWTRKQLALLGTADDATVARKLGRSVTAVTVKRVKLKIPAVSGWAGGGRPWVSGEVAVLGTADDGVIAAKLGRTERAVMQKRVALKIPVFSGLSGGGRGWTAAEEMLLGTNDDEVIARRVGRSAWAVTVRRVALAIPVFRDRRKR